MHWFEVKNFDPQIPPRKLGKKPEHRKPKHVRATLFSWGKDGSCPQALFLLEVFVSVLGRGLRRFLRIGIHPRALEEVPVPTEEIVFAGVVEPALEPSMRSSFEESGSASASYLL